MLSEFKGMGVEVVGISVDTVERLRRFHDKHGLGFPLLSDGDRALGAAYGTLKNGPLGTHERDTVVIAADGTIQQAYQRVRAAGHADDVLAEARRLREAGLI